MEELENLFDLNLGNLSIQPLGKKDVQQVEFINEIPCWDDIFQLRIIARCIFCKTILGIKIVNNHKEHAEFVSDSLMDLRCHIEDHNNPLPYPYPNTFMLFEGYRINQIDSFTFHN